MKEFWNTMQFIFTVLGGWIGYFLGGCDGLIIALIQDCFRCRVQVGIYFLLLKKVQTLVAVIRRGLPPECKIITEIFSITKNRAAERATTRIDRGGTPQRIGFGSLPAAFLKRYGFLCSYMLYYSLIKT